MANVCTWPSSSVSESRPFPCTPTIPDLRDLSSLLPFGSPAVLPQQPICSRSKKRRARRRPRATGPQPMVPTAHSTQVAHPQPLMNLDIDAPPLPIPRAVPANPQLVQPAQPIYQRSPDPQANLDTVRKTARKVVRISSAAVQQKQKQPSPLQPYCTLAVESNWQGVRAHSTQASSSKPVPRVLFCCAVLLRSTGSPILNCDERLLMPAMCNQSETAACNPPFNPHGYVTASNRRVNRLLAARTLAFDMPCNIQYPIPISAPAVSPRALNFAQPAADTLMTALPQPMRIKLQLITSARAHTPVVLPMWQHLHSPLVAQECVVASNAPCDVRSDILHNLSALYINCSSPAVQPTRS